MAPVANWVVTHQGGCQLLPTQDLGIIYLDEYQKNCMLPISAPFSIIHIFEGRKPPILSLSCSGILRKMYCCIACSTSMLMLILFTRFVFWFLLYYGVSFWEWWVQLKDHVINWMILWFIQLLYSLNYSINCTAPGQPLFYNNYYAISYLTSYHYSIKVCKATTPNSLYLSAFSNKYFYLWL